MDEYETRQFWDLPPGKPQSILISGREYYWQDINVVITGTVIYPGFNHIIYTPDLDPDLPISIAIYQHVQNGHWRRVNQMTKEL